MKYILSLLTLFFISLLVSAQTAEEYYSNGMVKFEQQEYNLAITEFTKAIELNKNYAEAFCKRGITKHELQDFQGAKGDIQDSSCMMLQLMKIIQKPLN